MNGTGLGRLAASQGKTDKTNQDKAKMGLGVCPLCVRSSGCGRMHGETRMWIGMEAAAARALMRSGVRRDQDRREIEGVEEGGVCREGETERKECESKGTRRHK